MAGPISVRIWLWGWREREATYRRAENKIIVLEADAANGTCSRALVCLERFGWLLDAGSSDGKEVEFRFGTCPSVET